jgi:hypothetical protein
MLVIALLGKHLADAGLGLTAGRGGGLLGRGGARALGGARLGALRGARAGRDRAASGHDGGAFVLELDAVVGLIR